MSPAASGPAHSLEQLNFATISLQKRKQTHDLYAVLATSWSARGMRSRAQSAHDLTGARYSPIAESIWSIVRDGSAQPASPTILAGTPATVTLCGTGFTTTEPAAMRAQWPTSILPRI